MNKESRTAYYQDSSRDSGLYLGSTRDQRQRILLERRHDSLLPEVDLHLLETVLLNWTCLAKKTGQLVLGAFIHALLDLLVPAHSRLERGDLV